MPAMGSFSGWNREAKPCTFSWFRLYPNSATPALDDSFADRKSDSCSRVLIFIMKAFEDTKNLVVVFRIDTDAIVFNR